MTSNLDKLRISRCMHYIKRRPCGICQECEWIDEMVEAIKKDVDALEKRNTLQGWYFIRLDEVQKILLSPQEKKE